MKNKLVSIIVPLYNSEKYLVKCIDSILNQKYSNFELLLIDDGSTDNSKKIIQSYVDARINYIYSKHFNVSSARNIGLKKAKGEYICFIDSDDEISPSYLELLVKNFSKNTDLVMCSYTRNLKMYTYKKDSINIGKDIAYKFILDRKFSGYVWNKLFKRDIIIKNNISFSQKLIVGEDTLFVSEYLRFCNNICVDYNKYYFYRNNENQITKRYDESISSVLFGWIAVLKIYEKECPRMTNEIKYRYLKKLIELKKIIPYEFKEPKIKIDYENFSLKQKITLKMYKIFTKQIIKIKGWL